MKRFATIIVTLGALVATACGGALPGDGDEVVRQPAPLWMAEQDLPGCDAVTNVDQATLMSHPFDRELVIAVIAGAPACVDTERHPLRALHAWPLPGRRTMATTVEPPEDDPVPIKGEEEEAEGTDQPRDGLDRVAVPNLNETISDDPVPIRGGKALKALHPTTEADADNEQ